MNRKIALSLAITSILASAAGFLLAGDALRLTTREAARMKLRNLTPANLYAAVIQNPGENLLYNSNLANGEVVVLGFNGLTLLGKSALIGFRTSDLINGGTASWPGVTVTVTVQITAASDVGSFSIGAKMAYGEPRTVVSEKRLDVSGPGTFTVTTDPCPMDPNKPYKGVGYVSVWCPQNEKRPAWVRAKITAININL